MAQRKVNGKDIFLFIDPAGGTDYSTIICLTTQSMKRATTIIDAASKCGPDSSPGAKTIGVDFSGHQMVSTDAGKISGADLHDLWVSSATVGWKMGPAVPQDGDPIYEGSGFVATLDDTYDLNNPATFSGSIGVYGTPSKTIYPAS